MRLLVFIIILFTGYSSVAFSQENFSTYIVFQQEGKEGLKDESGNVLIPAQYDQIGWSKGPVRVIESVIGFRKGNKWGLISISNEVIKPQQFSQLYPVSDLYLVAGKETQAIASDLLGLLSPDGDVELPFEYTSIQLEHLRAIVAKKQRNDYVFGIVDLSNKIILPIQYKLVKPLGSLRFMVTDQNEKVAIYNDQGVKISDFTFDSLSAFHHGRAIVYSDYKRGVIANDGRILSPPIYQQVSLEKENIWVKPFNQWQVLTGKNEPVAEFTADSVAYFNHVGYRAISNNRYWLIDKKGQAISKSYDYIGELQGHLCVVKNHGKWGVINQNGEVKIPLRYDSLYLNNHLAIAKSNTGWAVYDSFNIRKSEAGYQEIKPMSNFLFPVKKRDHWGFINRTGEEVIHCVYDEVGKFSHGYVEVSFHGERGVIDKSGEWVVLPHKVDSIEIIDKTYFISFKNHLKRLKTFDGDIIYFTENPIEIKQGYLLEHLSDGGIWKINFMGRIVEEAKDETYQEVRNPSEGFYAIKKDGRYGFIDAQNRLRIANRYEDVGPFKEGLAAFKLLNKWGFLDKKEQIVIQPVYQKVTSFNNGLAIVYNREGAGLINMDGQKISSFGYDSIFLQPNYRFLIKKNSKYGMLGKDGGLMINAKYDQILDYNNGFVQVQKDSRYGLVDDSGVNTIPLNFDYLFHDKEDNFYLVMKKSIAKKLQLQ